MANWGSQANNAANSVLLGVVNARLTANATNQTNFFNNVSSGGFKGANGVKPLEQEIGQFGVTTVAMNSANALSENKHVNHSGWNIRRAGTGGIATISVSNNGTSFANGESILFSNGTINATATVTTNSTGFMTNATMVGNLGGKGWAKASDVVTAFNREQHVANVTVTGVTLGFSNTDVVTCSNGSVNATATLSTNTLGGITNASFTVTVVGLFPNTFANNQVVVTVANSSGGASAGSGATFTVKVSPSTNGNVAITLGGRAGRIHYETLVASASLVGAGSTQLPNT